jgi:hypothetical protein
MTTRIVVNGKRSAFCCMCGGRIEVGAECGMHPPVKVGKAWMPQKECSRCMDLEPVHAKEATC